MAGEVIITRADPGVYETLTRLADAGLSALASPMLELGRTCEELPDMAEVTGLLFTSANGVRFFCEASARRDITAWCVGPATHAAAQQAGFISCHNAQGDGTALASLVIAQAAPEAGRLLHIANAAASGNVVVELRNKGFEVEFAPLYEARPRPQLPDAVYDALMARESCLVIVHSAKGAAAFAAASTGISMAGHHLVAVSEKAAGPLRNAGFDQIHLADAPNEEAILAAVFRAYSTL